MAYHGNLPFFLT